MLFIDFGASWQGRSVHTFEGGKQNRWQNLCLKKGWCSTYKTYLVVLYNTHVNALIHPFLILLMIII